MRLGPVAFLLLVPTLWAVVRGAMLWPRQTPEPKLAIDWAPPLHDQAVAKRSVADSAPVEPVRQVFRPSPLRKPLPPAKPAPRNDLAAAPTLTRYAQQQAPSPSPAADRPIPIPPYVTTEERQPRRFSLSAWMLVRGQAAAGLATAGQLGGRQAGLRARYRVSEGVHLAGRLSGPLRSRHGKEAAIGVDVRPIPSVAVTLTAERRIGLDRGGRDAFGIGAFGGFDLAVTGSVRIDGYAQAGVVGLKRRDAYVDGALRVERGLTRSIGVGAGVWGGAQPGAARLDIGPQLVLHVSQFRIGAEWRQRVAGDARPGSGPVLSLGADF